MSNHQDASLLVEWQRTAVTVKVIGLSNVFEVAPVHVKLVEFVNPG